MYSFSNIANNKIAVLGDVMLDHYVFGLCERISPEAPVQVVDIKSESYTLGGAGNVLKNLIALGCPSYFISVCGNDEGANIVHNEVARTSPYFFKLITDAGRQTTVKTRVLANKHQLLRLDREHKHDIQDDVADNLIEIIEKIIPEINILIISDYCKGVLTNYLAPRIIELCKKHSITIIVDSKDKTLSKYANVDIIKPNKKEAAIVSGVNIVNDETLALACQKIVEKTNCKTVIVTLSEDGMAIYNNGHLEKIATRAIDVFDVTGAGDTVIAALSFAIANGMTIHGACEFANRAAAVVVAKVGSVTASLEEINSYT